MNIKSAEKNRKWSQDEINLIQAVTDRLAVALENARLFEETTRRAERERLVSDITGKIRSVNDPQTMIQMAADELRAILGQTASR
jgi:GAF domain-containing protein